MDIADVLADHFKRIDHGGSRDDRSAMLVIVENRDVHALLELGFHLEAFRRLDILQVNAAKSGLQRGNDVDQLVGVRFLYLDIEHVNIGEFLEQDTLAFHDRLGGQGADVAKAQYRGAVRDHRNEIATDRQVADF